VEVHFGDSLATGWRAAKTVTYFPRSAGRSCCSVGHVWKYCRFLRTVEARALSRIDPPARLARNAASTQMEAQVHFPRFVQSAAASALLIIGFNASAQAQNNQQITSGTWYEDRASFSTITSTNLQLTFAQTPASQFLNITNVSCNVTVNSTQVINEMVLMAGTTSGGGDLNRQYEIKGNVTPETIDTAKIYSIVTNQIFYKFGPGRFPSILIVAGSTGSSSIAANCVIVGNLTDN
jgi:hypothetical protein